MNKVKIKRRLHQTDISEIEHRIEMLEDYLNEMRNHINEHPVNKSKISDAALGLRHGMYDLFKKVGNAIDSVGKEMQ